MAMRARPAHSALYESIDPNPLHAASEMDFDRQRLCIIRLTSISSTAINPNRLTILRECWCEKLSCANQYARAPSQLLSFVWPCGACLCSWRDKRRLALANERSSERKKRGFAISSPVERVAKVLRPTSMPTCSLDTGKGVGSHFTRKGGVPLERGGTTDTDSLGNALEGAAEHHLDRSDFGQVKGITYQLTAGWGLWVAKAVVAISPPEPGVAWVAWSFPLLPLSPTLTLRKNALKARSILTATFCNTWLCTELREGRCCLIAGNKACWSYKERISPL